MFRVITKLIFYTQPWNEDRTDEEWELIKMELTGVFIYWIDEDGQVKEREQDTYLNQLVVDSKTELSYQLWSEENDFAGPIGLKKAIEMLENKDWEVYLRG